MKLNCIFISNRSLSIELVNKDIYYNNEAFDVYLNDELVIKNETKNVFSLYNLLPSSKYEVKTVSKSNKIGVLNLTTLEESLTLNVRDFNAYGDGIKNDTLAIQTAILTAPKNARVLIPEGTYLVTSLFLKDNIYIELAKGAVLLGNTNRHDYPVLPNVQIKSDSTEYILGTWEGQPEETFASLITGIYNENVIIYGQGIIDENAHNSDWWFEHRVKRVARRPKGIFLNKCTNIQIQGITVKNTPSWNLHPYFSKDIRFIDMFLNSPIDSPTTDGIDPESCDGVDIIGVRISVGDDCIAIKSGTFEMGMKYQTPSENITIRNCYMQDGHGGVVLGSEMSGGVKNLNVSQCIFDTTDRGLRIKTRRGRGKYAIIDGVSFSNILMKNVKCPFVIDSFYKWGPGGLEDYVYNKEKLPIDDRTPYLGKFTFNDINAYDCEWSAGYFYGLPEQPIKEVEFNNVNFTFKKDSVAGEPTMMVDAELVKNRGLIFYNVENIITNNVTMTGHDGEFKEVHNK
ncbi:MAG TPA: glycoside hydrolase family 28 protein [Haploplasma sp.]|nr:glycoside hydrolase family 28 protein [Haploplasma sp.]